MCTTDSFEDYVNTTKRVIGNEIIGKVVKGKYKITDYCKDSCRFTLHCPVCSTDNILWNRGSITAKKDQMLKGKIPCGCNKIVVRWTTNQYKILLGRFFDKNQQLKYDKDFNCLEKITSNTRISMYNTLSGVSYNTTVFNILNEKIKFSDQGLSSNMEDSVLISKFTANGKYPDGTLFERIEGEVNYWRLTCPICKNDDYTKEGYCNGIFRIHVTNLGNGVRPCRCYKGYKGGEDWRVFKINAKLKRTGASLLYVTGYNPEDTIFYKCENNHELKLDIKGFLSKHKIQCRSCLPSSNRNGFYKKRKEEQDNLYIIQGEGFMKVGRTFNLTQRLTKLKRRTKSSLKVIHLFRGKHKDVYHYEQEVLRMYRTIFNGLTWTNETFKTEDLEEVYDFLQKAEDIKEEQQFL